MSAAEATYGPSLVLPSQLQPPPRVPPAAPAKVEIPSTIKPAKKAEKTQEVGVQEATHVYVREGAVIGPLDATYRGPLRLLVRERKKLLLEIGATQTWISVDRLKPHVGAKTPKAAQSPARASHLNLNIFIRFLLYDVVLFSFVFPMQKKLGEGNVTDRYHLSFFIYCLESM